ncbi:MAG: hypothetical protein FJX68_02320 [Alphaproteobacteria bacterium]|nr:hypothetical protein [Alphaproteobacteria bacterium]
MLQPLAQLGRSTLIYGLGLAAGRLLSLLTLPIFTRYLSATEFGLIALLLLAGMVARQACGLGIGGAAGIVYFRAADASGRAAALWTAAMLTGLGALALLGLAWLAAPALGGVLLDGAERAGLIRWHALGLAAGMLAEMLLLRLQFESRPAAFVLLSVGQGATGLALSYLLVVEAGFGIAGWIVGNCGGALLGLLAVLLVVLAGCRPAFDRHLVRPLLTSGLPLVPGGLLTLLLFQGATYAVAREAGLAVAGQFSIALQFGAGMMLLTGAFGNAWYPYFQSHAGRPEEAARQFPRLVSAYAFGFGLAALAFFAVARPLVALLTEAGFHAAYRGVGWSALAYYLLALWSMLLPALYFARETWLVLPVQAAAVVYAAGGHVLLLPALGLEGAAMAVALGAGGMVATQLLANRLRGYRLPMTEPGRLLAALSALAVAVLTQRAIDESLALPLALPASAALLAAYAAVGWRGLGRERLALTTRLRARGQLRA